MFTSFFYLLRARGLKVSMNEWLTLIDALDRGLAGASLTGFYYLCRSILVKSEVDFDKFDGAFLEFFRDLEFAEELPQELLDWLENPKDRSSGEIDYETAGRNQFLSNEEIQRRFRERLEEQKEEHNGGSYWIGTGGVSVFGNSGYSPKGIRVGGESRHRLAMQVAGERRFRDFRDDQVLDTRRFQMAFRSLRQFSSKTDAPKTELNIDESIRETGDSAGRLKLVFDRPRKNTVKLLLLMDSGGSMDYYSALCTSLFQAVHRSGHFKDLKIYYFHNCIKGYLYTTPQISYTQRVSTQRVLQNLDSSYRVILVGDALMDAGELMEPGYDFNKKESTPSGLEWLRLLSERYPRMVWLNPAEKPAGYNTWWGQTYDIIANEVDMYTLTVENLEKAIKKLMVSR